MVSLSALFVHVCNAQILTIPARRFPAKNVFREVVDRSVQMARVLQPGKGGRLYLADTEELYNRIEDISSRNRELEAALRKLQETVSPEQPHPLLATNVLRLNTQQGTPSEPSTSSSSKSPSTSRISPTTHPPETDLPGMKVDEEQHVVDAFGTLAVNRLGESSFLGRSARPEYLVTVTNLPRRMHRPALPRLSLRIREASFPERELYNDTLLAEILEFLPPQAEALHLCEVYLEYGKYLYAPISKHELLEETLAVVYRARQHHHLLSLLYIVFSIATLFNPNQQPFSTDAQEYYYLSRTSLGFTQPFHETSLTSIQILIHMAHYIELSDMEPEGFESAWIHVGNAVRLGMKAGLNLNSTRWKLPEIVVQRRHDLFWRLFVTDTWSSFYLGRFPSISTGHFDCPAPSNTVDSNHDSTDFYQWNISFAILLHDVLQTAFGPKEPPYSTITDLDRKIRDFHVPSQWITPDEGMEEPPLEIAMYRWLVLSAKEIISNLLVTNSRTPALLNLHRSYFALALQESSGDLQRHRYLPSVVAIYRSSWRLVRGLALTWTVIPKFLARVTLAWSHGLSAAVVLCLLVTRAPTSPLTTPALEELDHLNSLFDSAAPSCGPAEKLLNSVQTLRRKAQEAVGLPHFRFHHTDEGTSISTTELDRLNGKTYLHTDNGSSGGPTTMDPRSRATSVTISDIADGHNRPSPFHNHNIANLHPTIVRDLREFSHYNAISTTPSSMSFSDVPSVPLPTTHTQSHSNPRTLAPPPPPRDPSPETDKLLLQQFDPTPSASQSQPLLPPRNESLFQSLQAATYFHTQPDSFLDPRSRMGMGMMFAPGFQSGFTGGYGASPIALDPSWNNFVEQLGFG
uniref:Xylanolytic transcriptional activator regulatory domain-containing protein n=1 Tax=Psilocybe cubensis TaxID=181762 RepID=A0A8H7Y991_PSICU